jgi:uncharacterized membrane protein YfcA
MADSVMPNAKTILFVLLGIFAALFCVVWMRELLIRNMWRLPTRVQAFIGFFTNFFDTLGISSFATTTSIFRFRKVVADELIPGTLNVGHTLPTVAQAYIYITIVEVEMKTLVLMIVAAMLGGWFGAGVVSHLPKRKIQVGMGLALLAASAFILVRLLFGNPEHEGTQGLEGGYLIVGLIGNFVFAAIMMVGVGAYAPIMIMVSFLGMNPTTAYPIMMGSCAFLMPLAGIRFVRAGKYDARAALGLTLGGIPAVLIAAFLVVSLPLDAVRWLVLIVVVYTALSILWSARRAKLSEGTKPLTT